MLGCDGALAISSSAPPATTMAPASPTLTARRVPNAAFHIRRDQRADRFVPCRHIAILGLHLGVQFRVFVVLKRLVVTRVAERFSPCIQLIILFIQLVIFEVIVVVVVIEIQVGIGIATANVALATRRYDLIIGQVVSVCIQIRVQFAVERLVVSSTSAGGSNRRVFSIAFAERPPWLTHSIARAARTRTTLTLPYTTISCAATFTRTGTFTRTTFTRTAYSGTTFSRATFSGTTSTFTRFLATTTTTTSSSASSATTFGSSILIAISAADRTVAGILGGRFHKIDLRINNAFRIIRVVSRFGSAETVFTNSPLCVWRTRFARIDATTSPSAPSAPSRRIPIVGYFACSLRRSRLPDILIVRFDIILHEIEFNRVRFVVTPHDCFIAPTRPSRTSFRPLRT